MPITTIICVGLLILITGKLLGVITMGWIPILLLPITVPFVFGTFIIMWYVLLSCIVLSIVYGIYKLLFKKK